MKKILIIEDDPIVAHIYRTRLEKEAYSVETCADGQAGFYRVHEFNPDGILLDLMLPKMNGIEILKKIRAQSKFGSTPIVVFTNAYVPNMIQEAFSAGASQVFNKATLTPRQILDALHLLLNGGTLPETAAGFPGLGSPRSGYTSFSRRPADDPMASLREPAFHSPQPGNAQAGSPPPPRNQILSEELERTKPAPKPGPVVPRVEADDSRFQSELRHAFEASKAETMATLRKLLQDFTKASNDGSRMPHLHELYRKVHALTGNAGIAGFTDIAQMTAALEVLLSELSEKPKHINASTLRTVAHSVDFLADLFKIATPRNEPLPETNILVVDDEILSRRAITYALEKANLKSTNVEDPAVALEMAGDGSFDVIFLDVQMPGMDGFELCTKIRTLSPNKYTPIIFVTSLTDFKSRAKSSLSGGTDLIAKPFMFIELTVKALTHVLRGRLMPKRQAA